MDRRRRSAAIAAVVVPAVALIVVGADTGPTAKLDTEVVPVAAVQPAAAPAAPAVPAERGVRRNMRFPLPAGRAPEKGLQVETILAARAVSARFPQILDIGGVRADSMKWHPNGLAIDVMIPNYGSPEGKALGDRIVAYVLDNADRIGVNHLIFRQHIYYRGKAPRMMSDRGGDTANHYDHVHIATNGGGFPTGHETYLT
ncbi:hypothetical protein [Mycolicibacterium lutetiense]|jgi:hypothetical protein|uniref:ARB-07466-like C-terminal domain-containing protein n=1 Tax=Mycolicibacterium lutetiense TaxID=1641992 RepID=A0ABS4ZRA2_9MYCO|nr:hypothetical protein [Mycolicibacterium lutetiense]MBP2452038.1 hypothetical protein [Mycolicibacterium lutetiense]